jgi:4-hydroxybutyryl-CoA dehydratase / vinylacetyl-CoA-Delta-isomerase
MGIRTAQQYVESLRDDRVVYMLGERVKDVTRHPILRIAIDWMGMDYVIQQDPRYQSLVTEKNEKGELVSFIFTPQKSMKDLLRLREVVQLWARTSFGKPSGAKFVGKDGLNSVTVVSQRIDKQFGTDYSKRIENYRKYLQDNDSSIALAMTDVKGDRALHPSQQKDHQDYYVRILEERSDGIIVRGAKAHISGAPLSNEILVLPCRAMREDDKAYAVSFGIQANAKGITMISAEPELKDREYFDDYPISSAIYINDAVIVFDDVFIPNDRIFMKGEWPLAGDIAYMFGNFHRLSAETYKAVELELVAGIAKLMAEYNGIDRASHVQEKLTWLVMYAEATEILGRAACEHCVSEPDSGLVYPNPMIANIAKFFFAENWHQATKYLHDIAGGIMVTAPSSKDYANPETHDMIDKYLRGSSNVPTEYRFKLIKLIRDLTSCYEDVLTIHAEGSLAAQKLSIATIADFERYKASAKRAARIKDGTEHPLFSQLPEFPKKIT